MTPLARALLGGALTACLTLFIHPDSRPYMTGLVPRPGEAQRIRAITGAGTGPMVAPQSTAEAGLWMQLGCARLTSGQKLSKEELESLLRLARYMEKWDQPPQFDNAFWPQMEAVFSDQLGDESGAKRAWEEATKCKRWKDYQATRLLDEADQTRSPLAWHFAGLYYERRFAVGAAIIDFARRAIDSTGQKDLPDVEFRYATLVNAYNMAFGAQSVEILRYASSLADLTVQPPHAPPLVDNVKWRALRDKARGKFSDSLNILGLRAQADDAATKFSWIDSRPVVTQQFRPTETAARISTESVVTATLPDALLIVALLGAVAWPIGTLVLKFSLDHASFAWPATLIFAALLGLGAIWLALPPLAAFVALLCVLLLMFSPKNERSLLPPDLGPLFTWMVGLLSVLFILAIVLCLAALSTPAKLLLPSILEQTSDVIGSQFALVLIGLATILFALLLLVAPMWAFARRVRTPFVLGLALRTFGMTLVIVGLAGTVILSPICIYADSMARRTLVRIVSNEPEHYSEQFR